MLILSDSPADKGKQLEELTLSLLSSLGYTNCVSNVLSGGGEIDVRGEFPLPHPGGVQTYALICECKAHRNVVDMPEWDKFLGKLYFEESCRHADVGGCFIALSGVNGYVQGVLAYTDVAAAG